MNVQTRKTISTLEQLDALAWAASRSGKSYGAFTARLSAEEKELIYGEYLAWQKAEADARAERAKLRRRMATPPENEWDDAIPLNEDEE